MNTKEKILYTRIISAVLLLFLTVAAVLYMNRVRELSIKTVNDVLPYVYSDDELGKLPVPEDDGADILLIIADADKKYDIGEEFLNFCVSHENINSNGNLLSAVKRRIESSGYSDNIWADMTGYTFSVLYDIYTGAAFGDGVTLLTDVYDQRKTTVMITADEADKVAMSDSLADTFDAADLAVSGNGDAAVNTYISGGVKFAVAVGEDADAVASAKAVCDFVIAVTKDGEFAESAAMAGADAVFVTDKEAVDADVEYHLGVPVVYGISPLGSDGGEYMTVTMTVGVAPILRYYSCAVKDGVATELTGDELTAAILDINERSESATVDDDGRIKNK